MVKVILRGIMDNIYVIRFKVRGSGGIAVLDLVGVWFRVWVCRFC